MKPAPFELSTPTSLGEALALLAEDAEAKPLAGGQSLLPLMAFRLARPSRLVDLGDIAELRELRITGDELVIGAGVRQRDVELSPEVREGWPLLGEALRFVAHPPIRNRGTVVGSLAHADPAAELPAVMLAYEAVLEVRSTAGARTVPARSFFNGPFTTLLAEGELVTAVHVPRLPPGAGWGFAEVARRHGDFAVVAVACVVGRDAAGAIARARLAYAGAAPTPVRALAAEASLVGERPGAEVFRAAAALLDEALAPVGDIHASARYRRHVAAALTERALAQACGPPPGSPIHRNRGFWAGEIPRFL